MATFFLLECVLPNLIFGFEHTLCTCPAQTTPHDNVGCSYSQPVSSFTINFLIELYLRFICLWGNILPLFALKNCELKSLGSLKPLNKRSYYLLALNMLKGWQTSSFNQWSRTVFICFCHYSVQRRAYVRNDLGRTLGQIKIHLLGKALEPRV